MFNKSAKDKSSLSLGKSKVIYGYEVKKMPIGAYLKAMERIKNMPEDFIETCFPGQSLQEVFDSLTKLDEIDLKRLILSVMTTAPKYAIALISELIEVDEEQLINDENIGINGIIDLCIAFIEVNKLGEAFAGVKELRQKIKTIRNVV